MRTITKTNKENSVDVPPIRKGTERSDKVKKSDRKSSDGESSVKGPVTPREDSRKEMVE